ncbi:hypothetical protein Y882_10585 [Dyella japonica DSM 16301]|uniref:Uncharacterized protein n=1 Tax=Dyella japonica DSM 16301 TaxID=1440762 RepID=A0A0G9H7H2_9GAMM|nr:hypothetical protein Y882_10585 [Dyella japonica DSM 16301]
MVVAVMAAVAPMATVSAKQPPPPDVKADTRESFAPVADHVREQMQAGGRFEFVNAQERDTVAKDLGDMQSLFDRFTKVDAMDDKSKIQLYNDQSEVNAILTRRDGDKEVCVHEQPTGSHLPKTTCRKYSDMERDRAATMQMKDEMLHTTIPKPLLIGPNAH